MTQPNEVPPLTATTPLLAELRSQLGPLLFGVPLLTLLTGAAFPIVLAVLARPLFPHQADGSLVARDGVVVGSDLIGQSFSGPATSTLVLRRRATATTPRPRAAPTSARPTRSSATRRCGERSAGEPIGARNGLPPDAVVPIDAVTRSGSGLDPHISPANAALQVGACRP